jgi:hypothetical protein
LLVEIDANWVLKIWDKPVNKNWNWTNSPAAAYSIAGALYILEYLL